MLFEKIEKFRTKIDPKNADANRADEHGPVIFHYRGHVFARSILRLRRSSSIRDGQIRTGGFEVT